MRAKERKRVHDRVTLLLLSFQVLLVHKASKGSFSRVFDFEANDLAGEDSDSRTRWIKFVISCNHLCDKFILAI